VALPVHCSESCGGAVAAIDNETLDVCYRPSIDDHVQYSVVQCRVTEEPSNRLKILTGEPDETTTEGVLLVQG
jgi:hypothetical protein